MNPIIYVILAILLVVILYYVYIYLTTTPILVKTVDLSVSEPQPVQSSNPNFLTNKVSNIQNIRYTYSVWIYIDALPGLGDNTLFYFGNKEKGIKNFRLYLDDGDASILKVDIKCKNIKTIIINPSFPLQRWTNVIVSIDSNFVDIYQDGKLTTSSSINKPDDQIIRPDVNSGVFFGNGSTDQIITLGNLMRWPHPIDPATAYSVFLQGNGQPSGKGGVKFHLWSKTGDAGLKNNIF
jgi:hypothetical protein